MHEKRLLCYDMAMLPTLTPDNAGDAGFLGPSRAPTQKADMGTRARACQRTQKKQPKKSSPQASPETQTQQDTVNSSVLWLGRARARRAPKSPKTNGKKARTAQRASQPQQEQNGQNNSPTLSAAVFWRYLQRFGERGRQAPKCAKMSLAYTPPTPS